MSKRSRNRLRPMAATPFTPAPIQTPTPKETVESLLDAIIDGKEYTSIVDKAPPPGTNILTDVIRGLAEIENLRKRPCIAYVGNVVKKSDGDASVDAADDLPFREMVAQVPADARSVDVYLATLGGSGHQVNSFVNCLRARFDEVHFLIPSFCMSAGTLFALSGDTISMTDRACLGPIDPQVPTKDGRYVPAQALLLLVDQIQRDGEEALRKGSPVPWAAVRVIDTLDKKELGEAMTASLYSKTMAAQFLRQYKFKNWTVRETSRLPVAEADREARANEIAAALVSHERWKSHGHAIPRDVLWSEVQLRIDHPDAALNRAIVRLWALMYWIFDKMPIMKMLCSTNYSFLRHIEAQLIRVAP